MISATVLCLSAAAATAAGTPIVDRAVIQAGKSGRPVMLTLGSEGCGICQALMKSLESDARLKSSAGKFERAHLDFNKDRKELTEWMKKSKLTQVGFPSVFLLKPGGALATTLYPVPATQALTERLEAEAKTLTVRKLTPGRIAEIAAAESKAIKLLADHKVVSACEALAKFECDLDGSHPDLKKAQATRKKLIAAAVSKVAESRATALGKGSEAERFDAAVQLSALASVMASCKEVGPPAADGLKVLRGATGGAALADQATLWTDARAGANADDEEKARQRYRDLVAKHPGSVAAQRAAKRLEEFEKL
jgi:hypothetical protein